MTGRIVRCWCLDRPGAAAGEPDPQPFPGLGARGASGPAKTGQNAGLSRPASA